MAPRDPSRRTGPAPLASLGLLAALTLLWGSNWPAMKVALRDVDPWTFRTLCLVVGGGSLLLIVRLSGLSLRVAPAERGPLALAALFNITLWHILSAYALTRIQAGRGAILAYTMPLWTVVFGWLWLGERLTRPRATALGLGLCGLLVLIAPEAAAVLRAPAGALCMLGAAASWAFGTLLMKRFRWTTPSAVLTGWQLLAGAVPIALGTLVLGGAPRPTDWPLASALGVAYAVLVGAIFCHWAWFRLVATLPAAIAAIGTLGIPIVGVFSSALVLGEAVGRAEVLALVLVVAGLGVLVAGLTPARASEPSRR